MVIVLVGVMAGIAMPRYARSIARYRADMAAKRIVADLNLAQSRARSQSASQTVTFTAASNEYQIVGMADIDHLTSTYTVKLSEEPYNVTLTGATFGGDSSIVFDIYGVPDSTGSAVVTCGDVTKTITVNVDTGVASVQ
jgi:Tfp pilus assembly protein FimT